jgi:uncharacterized coiled-coil protein SlyX
MKFLHSGVLIVAMLCLAVTGYAQTAAPSSPSPAADQKNAQIEQKIETISTALSAAEQQIEQSQRQVRLLQQQLLELRQQMAAPGSAAAPVPTAPANSASAPSSSSTTASSESDEKIPIEERLQVLEAAVKLHDQTKVESGSKYPVRLTGLILLNGFLNKGVADNVDLPEFALHGTATSGNGDLGAGLRQTILGIEGNGPHIAGARTSAQASLDFFSSVSYAGYGTSAGVVRMRTASINFDWERNSLQAGFVEPLISPLSPDSYATVAEPALAGAGNFWTWAPQLSYTHRFELGNGRRVQYQFGLWDSPAAGYNSNQLFRTASPGELAQLPAYETRVSYAAAGDRGLQLGVGGYYSRQAYPGYQGYPGTENIDSWAGTADWRVPLGHYFEIIGEGYRGRSIGGLGGGGYKDIIAGTSPATGASLLRPLDAIGGWTQFKTRFTSTLEQNFSIGLDNGFANDFHAVVQSPTATAVQLRARNRMFVSNLIFRPKTYIILSPEYRRIWSWPITGPANTLNVYTLSIGYQF